MNKMRKAAAFVVMLCMLLTLLPSTAMADDLSVRKDSGARIVQSGYENGILSVKVQVKDPEASGISTFIGVITFDTSLLTAVDIRNQNDVVATTTTNSSFNGISRLARNDEDDAYTISERHLYGTDKRALCYVGISVMTGKPNDSQKTTDWVDVYGMQFRVKGSPADPATVLYSDSIRFANINEKDDKVILDACEQVHFLAGAHLTTVGILHDGKERSGVYLFNVDTTKQAEAGETAEAMEAGLCVNQYPGSDREPPKPALNSTVAITGTVKQGETLTATITKSSEDTELTSFKGKWYMVVPAHDGDRGGDQAISTNWIELNGSSLTNTYQVTADNAACKLKFVAEGFDKDGNSLGVISATTSDSVPKNACSANAVLPTEFVAASNSLQIKDATVGQEYTVVDLGEVVEKEESKPDDTNKDPAETGKTEEPAAPAAQAEGDTPDKAPENYTWTKASSTSVTISDLTSKHTYKVWTRVAETWNTLAGTAAEAANTVDTTASASGGIVIGGNKHTVTVESTENGKITTDKGKDVPKGTVVTVTVTPDEGYKTTNVKVVDSAGKVVTVTKNDDGTYSFVMPERNVKISAEFASLTEAPSSVFDDVTDEKWFAESVKYVSDHGLMVGTSNRLFSPDAPTTRAMIVTILYRLAGEPEAQGNPFTDVAAGSWYAKAVSWAAANGIVGGYGNGKFGPEDNITREQMAAILFRYAAYMGYDVTASADMSVFTDVGSVAGYAVQAMSWANAKGLISGITQTTLSPQGNATRAQVSMILMRFCENVAPSAK